MVQRGHIKQRETGGRCFLLTGPIRVCPGMGNVSILVTSFCFQGIHVYVWVFVREYECVWVCGFACVCMLVCV